MYTVYVLRDGQGHLYKRLTNNFVQRLKGHQGGNTRSTKRMKDIEIVYTEEYDNFIDARARELYFKSAAGRRFLKKKLPM